MLKLLTIIILGVSALNANAQISSEDLTGGKYNIDSLRKIYGKHKHFLKEYEQVSLIALSYYPELIHESIRFKFSSISSTARTTVTFISVFGKENKQYIIYINDNIERTGMLLNEASFDAQVALIAHELAHVMDFKGRGFLSMAWWGASYLFVKQRAKIEKMGDEMVIKRGLGLELYDWADFVLNKSKANKHYLKMKQTKYLQPNEILAYIKKYYR